MDALNDLELLDSIIQRISESEGDIINITETTSTPVDMEVSACSEEDVAETSSKPVDPDLAEGESTETQLLDPDLAKGDSMETSESNRLLSPDDAQGNSTETPNRVDDPELAEEGSSLIASRTLPSHQKAADNRDSQGPEENAIIGGPPGPELAADNLDNGNNLQSDTVIQDTAGVDLSVSPDGHILTSVDAGLREGSPTEAKDLLHPEGHSGSNIEEKLVSCPEPSGPLKSRLLSSADAACDPGVEPSRKCGGDIGVLHIKVPLHTSFLPPGDSPGSVPVDQQTSLADKRNPAGMEVSSSSTDYESNMAAGITSIPANRVSTPTSTFTPSPSPSPTPDKSGSTADGSMLEIQICNFPGSPEPPDRPTLCLEPATRTDQEVSSEGPDAQSASTHTCIEKRGDSVKDVIQQEPVADMCEQQNYERPSHTNFEECGDPQGGDPQEHHASSLQIQQGIGQANCTQSAGPSTCQQLTGGVQLVVGSRKDCESEITQVMESISSDTQAMKSTSSDTRAMESHEQSASSDTRAMESHEQSASSDTQSMESHEQFTSSDTQVMESHEQSASSDTQSMESHEQFTSSDTQVMESHEQSASRDTQVMESHEQSASSDTQVMESTSSDTQVVESDKQSTSCATQVMESHKQSASSDTRAMESHEQSASRDTRAMESTSSDTQAMESHEQSTSSDHGDTQVMESHEQSASSDTQVMESHKQSASSDTQVMEAHKQSISSDTQVMESTSSATQAMEAHKQSASSDTQVMESTSSATQVMESTSSATQAMESHKQSASSDTQVMESHEQSASSATQVMESHEQSASSDTQVMESHEQSASSDTQAMESHAQSASHDTQVMESHEQSASSDTQAMESHAQSASCDTQVMESHEQPASSDTQVIESTSGDTPVVESHKQPTSSDTQVMDMMESASSDNHVIESHEPVASSNHGNCDQKDTPEQDVISNSVIKETHENLLVSNSQVVQSHKQSVVTSEIKASYEQTTCSASQLVGQHEQSTGSDSQVMESGKQSTSSSEANPVRRSSKSPLTDSQDNMDYTTQIESCDDIKPPSNQTSVQGEAADSHQGAKRDEDVSQGSECLPHMSQSNTGNVDCADECSPTGGDAHQQQQDCEQQTTAARHDGVSDDAQMPATVGPCVEAMTVTEGLSPAAHTENGGFRTAVCESSERVEGCDDTTVVQTSLNPYSEEGVEGMSDVLGETDLQDMDPHDEVTCPRCLKIYLEPVALPCGHVLCRDRCVRRIIRYDVVLQCPVCSQKFYVAAQGGVDSLPSVQRVHTLMSELGLETAAEKDGGQDEASETENNVLPLLSDDELARVREHLPVEKVVCLRSVLCPESEGAGELAARSVGPPPLPQPGLRPGRLSCAPRPKPILSHPASAVGPGDPTQGPPPVHMVHDEPLQGRCLPLLSTAGESEPGLPGEPEPACASRPAFGPSLIAASGRPRSMAPVQPVLPQPAASGSTLHALPVVTVRPQLRRDLTEEHMVESSSAPESSELHSDATHNKDPTEVLASNSQPEAMTSTEAYTLDQTSGITSTMTTPYGSADKPAVTPEDSSPPTSRNPLLPAFLQPPQQTVSSSSLPPSQAAAPQPFPPIQPYAVPLGPFSRPPPPVGYPPAYPQQRQYAPWQGYGYGTPQGWGGGGGGGGYGGWHQQQHRQPYGGQWDSGWGQQGGYPPHPSQDAAQRGDQSHNPQWQKYYADYNKWYTDYCGWQQGGGTEASVYSSSSSSQASVGTTTVSSVSAASAKTPSSPPVVIKAPQLTARPRPPPPPAPKRIQSQTVSTTTTKGISMCAPGTEAGSHLPATPPLPPAPSPVPPPPLPPAPPPVLAPATALPPPTTTVQAPAPQLTAKVGPMLPSKQADPQESTVRDLCRPCEGSQDDLPKPSHGSTPNKRDPSPKDLEGQPPDKKAKAGAKGSRNVWVGNLPAGTKAVDVRELLAECGKVGNCKVAANKKNPDILFAMVTMETAEDAAICISQFNNTLFNGSAIVLKKLKG